jgi:hypothetical protein
MTLEEAKLFILAKADEIRDTVDRSNFCSPECEACLRAKAKGLVDDDHGITNNIVEVIMGALGSPTLETVTDRALFELRFL